MPRVVYGLELSSDRPIPAPVGVAATRPRVTLRTGSGSRHCQDHGTLLAQTDGGVRLHELPDRGHRSLEYPDGTYFLIARDGSQVWMDWRPPNDYEDALVYFLGPVLGYVLRLKGIVSLHASAVAVDGKALALVGPPGAGKSTLAAALAMQGVTVIAEDVLPVSPDALNEPLVVPGYPRIRLWPESVRALFGSECRLPLVSPNWDKQFLDLQATGAMFQDGPLPLGAIYLLQERNTSPGHSASVAASEALIKLVANTYVNYLLDPPMRAHEFRILADLVARVPVRTFTAHDDPRHLSDDCGRLVADFRSTIKAQPV